MKDFGLAEELRSFTDYILGTSKVPYIPYNESGDWEKFLPRYENQTTKLGNETFGCTVWGSQNQIETMYKFLYKTEPNYSERFTYLGVPVNPGYGADPQNTYETIRRDGLVDEKDLPMTDTIEQYLNKTDITDAIRQKGQEWIKRHDFKHEWLWSKKPANHIEILRDALKTSPIGISVQAWNEENGVYVSYGDSNNHWCLLYKIDEDEFLHVFDSYDHTKKILSNDHNIRRAKRIWLNKKTVPAMKRHVNILQVIINTLMLFSTPKKTLLQVCTEGLGKDITPDDLIPDTVSCAITVSTLLNSIDSTFPKVAGTWTLWDILAHRKDYQRVTVPSPETIVISPTGTGNGSIPGHTGIIMEDGTIASNDSATGKFIKNYTLDTWARRYVDKGGFKIYMFKKI